MIPKSIQCKILAFCAVLYGIYLVSEGSDAGKQSGALEKNGITVPGVIESAEERAGGTRRHRTTDCFMVVSYNTRLGEPRKSEFEVTRSFFDSKVRGEGMRAAITSPQVEVRYMLKDTKLAMIVGGSVNKSSNFWWGILIAAGGIGGLIYLFLFNPFED